MSKEYIDDPVHGLVTVIQNEHSTIITNAKPDTHGRWVNHGNSYTYMPYTKAERQRLTNRLPSEHSTSQRTSTNQALKTEEKI